LDRLDRRGGRVEVKREFKIKLGDAEFPVVAEDDNTITVDGRVYTVEVADDGKVLVDGIAHDVALEGETATVDEESYDVQAIGLALAAAASPPAVAAAAPTGMEAGAGAVMAIMPGKIIRVMVEVGQEVAEGEAICVLEAMKMENELHARQAGTVKALYVKPGDDVEKDQVLAEIE
jgi:biotin carboxyl carrier protein